MSSVEENKQSYKQQTTKQNKSSTKKIKVFKTKRKRGLTEDDTIKKLQVAYESIDVAHITSFKDIPLSLKSLKGLKENGYTTPTEIQRHAICPALQGRDILGAAVTGSGKTLAFLIPVLERLYVNKWTKLDGLGALIISPTRELAYQTFETLKKIGVHHDFSAGLIIGGKNLHFERKRMDQCNIIICTPGRLLQHMDENPLFNGATMQILILDEADRCLDLGFEKTMNAIIENLPMERQTLLFSATQTKSVRDLARLSLSSPTYVAPHENSEYSTPSALQQNYIVCELEDKVAMLYSFIRNHLKQKSIVFMASCKQVKYIYEVFCKLRPGTSLLALYGTLHQERREQIYEEFCRKSNVVLFATDLAARGLDFPTVNWVVQLDCPEDTNTYIHRAGRTARHLNRGESLLVLIPSEEEAMISALKGKKIPINKIMVDSNKLQSPQRKLEALLAEYQNLKDTAQRAFVAYVKSVHVMKDKSVFDVNALNTEAFAKSLGLVHPPRIRFLQRLNKSKEVKLTKKVQENSLDDNSSSEDEVEQESSACDNDHNFGFNIPDDGDSDDELLKMKRKDHEIEIEVPHIAEPELLVKEINSKNKALTKAAVAKKIIKKNIIANKKTTFNDEGEAILSETKDKRSDLARKYENAEVGGIDIEEAKKVLQEEDQYDKQRFREKIKAKHREEKKKLKNKHDEDEKDEFGSDSEDDGPDLSWLPDPDKIYGKQDNSNGENNDSAPERDNSDSGSSDGNHQNEDSESEDSDDIPVTIHKPKRKLSMIKGQRITSKKLKIDYKALSVSEAERLAMQLLGSK